MDWESARIAVLGAAGAVGREILPLLESRRVPPAGLTLLGSARSAGTRVRYCREDLIITEATDRSFEQCDLALFAASGEAARRFAPAASNAGTIVIDNSSAFREDPAIPLIVPEVNAHAMGSGEPPRLIANPNCSTILLLVAIAPIHRAFGVTRLVVSTYQAASGAGAEAMDELLASTRAALAGEPFEPSVFAEPAGFNCFSHDSPVDLGTGENIEERKMRSETEKILGPGAPLLSSTCIRVPVLRAHTETVNLTLSLPTSETDFRGVLAVAPGVSLIDDRSSNRFPTPLQAAGGANILVGRIRPDPTQSSEGKAHTGYSLMLAGDQLLKGAALNAVQIADLVMRRL